MVGAPANTPVSKKDSYFPCSQEPSIFYDPEACLDERSPRVLQKGGQSLCGWEHEGLYK